MKKGLDAFTTLLLIIFIIFVLLYIFRIVQGAGV